MTRNDTFISGVCIIQPRIFGDERGCFFESYNQHAFAKMDLNYNFVQDNQSVSYKNTIRGLHFQKFEHAQAKLVRCIQGTIIDVAVDLRPDSKTYGQHVAVELSGHNNSMLMIPRGFAHGFSVLSDYAVFAYKCDNFYNAGADGGLLWNDPALGIDWKVAPDDAILSPKDKIHPLLANLGRCF